MFHNYLRGRTRHRQRDHESPPVPLAVLRSNLLAPACPCSTSVNITPLQRPVVPREAPDTLRTAEETAPSPIPAIAERQTHNSAPPVPGLARHVRAASKTYGGHNTHLPNAGNPPPRFHFRENPWHSDARSSRTSGHESPQVHTWSSLNVSWQSLRACMHHSKHGGSGCPRSCCRPAEWKGQL